MTWLIGALLGLAALGVAAFPFVRKRRLPPEPLDVIEELQGRRQAVYRDVQVLHNDWVVGQVPDSEHQERLQTLRLQAALLLREEMGLRQREESLEEEVLALRGKVPTTKAPAAKVQPAKAAGKRVVCPNCSRVLRDGASECPACGAKVTEAATHG